MNQAALQFLIRHYGLDPAATDEQARAYAADLQRSGIQLRQMHEIRPQTIDEESRSVDVVIATEAPARMLDWDSWEIVDEVLLMEGLRLDQIRRDKLPFLDSHRRGSIDDVLGSIVDLATEEDRFIGRAVFSAVAQDAFTKTKEGHVDGISVGYQVHNRVVIDPEQSVTVGGTEFTASSERSLVIVTDWSAHEGSAVGIGADANAGTRSGKSLPANQTKPPKGGSPKMEKFRKLLIESFGMPEDFNDEQARAYAQAKGCPAESLEDEDLSLKWAKDEIARMEVGVTASAGSSGSDSDPLETEESANISRAEAEEIARVATEGARIAEQARVRNITEAAESYEDWAGITEIRDTAIQAGTGIEKFRAQLLKKLSESTPSAGRVSITEDETDKFRTGAAAFILNKQFPAAPNGKRGVLNDEQLARQLGIKPDEIEPMANAHHYRTLLHLAEDCLQRGGVNTRHMNKMDLAGRAFQHSTGDFDSILMDASRKAMIAAFMAAEFTWRLWVGRDSMADFKTHNLIALGGFGTLEAVPDGSPIPEHTLPDKHETWTLETFGRIFSITRQTIINDDMRAFTQVPALHAIAWGRTINRQCFTKLLANPTLTEDSTALFHADHNNLQAGAGYDPSTVDQAKDAIGILEKLLMLQTDQAGEPIGVQASVLISGPTNKRNFLGAVQETTRPDSSAAAKATDRDLTLVFDPEVENSNTTGNTTTGTWLLADPNVNPVVTAGFLDGNDSPRMEVEEGFTIEGTKLKVAGELATGVPDFRGGASATGVA